MFKVTVQELGDASVFRTPSTLRVVSFFFLVLPVAGLFTGYYREMGPVAIFQAVMYFFSFLGFRALARKREASGVSTIEPKSNCRYIASLTMSAASKHFLDALVRALRRARHFALVEGLPCQARARS